MKYLLLAYSLLWVFSSHAGDLPKFGKISKEELEMKSCSFEEDANALILYHACDVYMLGNTTVQDFKMRVKLFSDKEDQVTNIKINFDPEVGESIEDIEATTYNLVNGAIVATPLKKESILTEPLENGDKNKVFAMPNVKKGCVIEYKYRFKRLYSIIFPSWYFQHRIPTLISQYSSSIPHAFLLRERFLTTLPVDRKVNEGSATSDAIYTMKNIPALKQEKYMSSEYDYLQSIGFQLMQVTGSYNRNYFLNPSWGTELETLKTIPWTNYFYDILNRNIPFKSEYDEKIASIKDPKERLIFIYNYVRDNMTWNHKATFFSPRGIKIAWTNKTGSYGDINLILYNLLKEAGLEVYPVLTSTKDHGSVNKFIFSFGQFNTMLALVKLNGREYFLDASDKKLPYDMISPKVNNTIGFVLLKKSYEWKDIRDDNSSKNQLVIIGEIDEKGIMKGDIQLSNSHYERFKQIELWKRGKEKYIESFSEGKNGFSISTISIENENIDSLPFIQNISFQQKLQPTDNYNFFNLNFLPDFQENPFLADTRYADIDFDSKQHIVLRGTISIPEKYSIESIPENITLIMPDTSIISQRIITFDMGILSFKIDIDFKQLNYSQDQYPVLQDFYKRMFAMLNEKILIKSN